MNSCKDIEEYTSNISTRAAQWYHINNTLKGFFSEIIVDGQVCIRDTSLGKYMPKYTKLIIHRNKITCGCKTCIIAMLL